MGEIRNEIDNGCICSASNTCTAKHLTFANAQSKLIEYSESEHIMPSIRRARRKLLSTILPILLWQLTYVAHGAVITVDATNGVVDGNGGACSISEAIQNANDNAQSNSDCTAGTVGTDTINLTADVTLTTAFPVLTDGRNGTPSVTSSIILNGQGFVLQRDETPGCSADGTLDADEFRLLHIGSDSAASLSVQNIILGNGCVDGAGSEADGGGIFNRGTLSVTDSAIKDNSAEYGLGGFGGGIYNLGTITLIDNSTFADNTANFGAGINSQNGVITLLKNSTFSDNSADSEGGGIRLFGGTLATLQNVTFSGNSAGIDGGGIDNAGGTITLLQNSTFSGNSAVTSGNGIYNNSGSILTLTNNIFFNPASGDDCKSALGGTISTGTNNASDGTCPSTSGISAAVTHFDATLSDNGCSTPVAGGGCVKTHALMLTSNALNIAIGTPPSTDQRGFDRIATRDIGAYELIGDQDGDGMSDRFEQDNGLLPLDDGDAGLDPDLDNLTNLEEFNKDPGLDPNDPDTDSDGIDDALDRDPLNQSNLLCDPDFPTAEVAGQIITNPQSCAVSDQINVDDTEVQGTLGDLELIALTVVLEAGFKVNAGGQLSVISANPCAACP